MDPYTNPFSPGAGTPPPELVGRNGLIEEARILLGRVKHKRPERSILLTGLRGVGKTVLLNEFKRMAEDDAYHTIIIEAHEGKRLGELVVPELRNLLFELDRLQGAKETVRRALGVLRSFASALKMKMGDIELGLDIDPVKGSADTGDIEFDLPVLFQAVAEAASDRKTAVAILIDEIQYLNQQELAALIMALHRIQQRQMPLVLFGAGLPILPGLAGQSMSYAERLFNFPDIGPLLEADADLAIQEPAHALGVTFDPEALHEIFRLTRGYPYFLQEWAYVSWNLAAKSPVTLSVVHQATTQVIARLDQSFFRVRFDRLTAGEKNFLRAMASLGSGPTKTADVAAVLKVQVGSISPRRAKLIQKGMIYSPSHGDMAFTVPLFDEFMVRAMPDA